MRRSPQMRRARLTLGGSGLALAALLSVVVGAGTASGQEGDTSTTTAPPESTTTSTTAPPVTVVLDGGDIGIVPPGAGDPAAPPPPGPGEPGDPSTPDGGELAIPPELAVVVLPDPTPGLNAALADIDVTRARTALAAAEEARRSSEAAVAEAFAQRATALTARREAGARVRAARDIVDVLAVNALIYGDIAGLEPVVGPPSLDDLRDLELSDVAAEKVFADLARARAAYRETVAAELAATEHLVQVQQVTRYIHGEYLGLRRDLAEAIRDAAEARRQLGPTILGEAFLETPDLVAWYRTYYPVDPPVAPIADIIDAYLRVGAEEGVRGDIAFAQAILETGGFRSGHAQGFNFAGIGAYDGCAPVCGFRFRDLDAGVRAHLHLLRAYADPGVTSAQLAAPPDPKVAPERIRVRGCCARWTQLTGIWATDLNYDRKILGIYRLMVETARQLDRAQA